MKLVLLILISILVVIFAIQNSTIVTVTLFNKTFEGSLALVIILCYLIGVLSGFIYIIPSMIKKNLTISDLKQKLDNQSKDTKKPL